jgi:hypothetical protein
MESHVYTSTPNNEGALHDQHCNPKPSIDAFDLRRALKLGRDSELATVQLRAGDRLPELIAEARTVLAREAVIVEAAELRSACSARPSHNPNQSINQYTKSSTRSLPASSGTCSPWRSGSCPTTLAGGSNSRPSDSRDLYLSKATTSEPNGPQNARTPAHGNVESGRSRVSALHVDLPADRRSTSIRTNDGSAVRDRSTWSTACPRPPSGLPEKQQLLVRREAALAGWLWLRSDLSEVLGVRDVEPVTLDRDRTLQRTDRSWCSYPRRVAPTRALPRVRDGLVRSHCRIQDWTLGFRGLSGSVLNALSLIPEAEVLSTALLALILARQVRRAGNIHVTGDGYRRCECALGELDVVALGQRAVPVQVSIRSYGRSGPPGSRSLGGRWILQSWVVCAPVVAGGTCVFNHA